MRPIAPPPIRWLKRDRVLVGAAESLIELPRVRHAFTTRMGGVSPRPYATLNLQLKDDADLASRVRTNRNVLCQAIGLNADRLVTADQVHGDTVTVVDLAGVHCPATDALVTTKPDVPLLILVADCLPVVISDPAGVAVAAVHAGWRGVVSGVAVKAAAKVAELAGCRVADLHVGIGPGIGPCCFAVHEDVTEPLLAAVPTAPAPIWRNEQPYVDLGGSLAAQMTALGIQHLSRDPICTSCHGELFFSFRRDKGTTGRQGVIIWLDATDA